MSADQKTATLAPSVPLTASTLYTATVTTGAKTKEGVALTTQRTWRFTTGTSATSPAPQVSALLPRDGALGVATNTRVSASFNTPMDSSSFTTESFKLMQGGTPVAGAVTYGPGTSATFTPANPLAANAVFTATLTTAVKSAVGAPLASASTWSFTTGSTAALGPAQVNLGTAGNFAVLAKTAVSTVPPSAVTGDIGLGPAAASYLTGFGLVADATNTFATSPQVTGKLYAADYAVPTPTQLTTAVSNMEGAYTDAASRPTPDHLELGTGNLGGLTLAPGLYKWTSSVTVPTSVTLNGGANDVWILQTTGDLSIDANQRVNLTGGALARNVFWQVAGKVVLGAGAHFEGIVLCKTEVTLETGATLNGRILAQTQVALQQAIVTQPASN
jgi:hypothetical protein